MNSDLEQRARDWAFESGFHRKNLFLMQWNGSKIPRGAQIGGIVIGWVQNGFVTGTNGQDLGVYERLEEFGGENKDRHFIAIMTDYDEVIDPRGQSIKGCPILNESQAEPNSPGF